MENFNTLPKISVLIPVYNSEKYIKRCLKSVLAQTYLNIEVVVVDDGSTDNSFNIVKQLEMKDGRIKLFQKQNEKSIPKTRNFLLKNKTGDLFCFVDSDDIIEKDFVKKLYSSMFVNNSDLSACSYKIQLFRLPIIRKFATKKIIINKEQMYEQMILGKTMHFMLWNKLFKSKLAEDITFDENVKYGEDFLFCFKYLKKCESISFFNVTLYHYMIHSGSMMHEKVNANQLSFLQGLYDLLSKETKPEIVEPLKAWIAFTSCYFLFASKKSKTIKSDKKIEFSKNISEYQQQLLKNKKTRYGYKVLFRLMKGLGKSKKLKKEAK